MIEKLPNSRPQFKRGVISTKNESFEFYFRDVLSCIQALYGCVDFAPYLVFAPERHYSDADQTKRIS